MPRLFFALWPDDSVRHAISRITTTLPGRPVSPENLHMTLVFLGQVGADNTQCFIDTIENHPISPDSLLLDHLGWWKQPRILWLAPRHTPASLVLFVEKLTAVCRDSGLSLETRRWRSHVTMAHKVKYRPALPEIEPIRWYYRDYCLVNSETQQQGPVYNVIWRSG